MLGSVSNTMKTSEVFGFLFFSMINTFDNDRPTVFKPSHFETNFGCKYP